MHQVAANIERKLTTWSTVGGGGYLFFLESGNVFILCFCSLFWFLYLFINRNFLCSLVSLFIVPLFWLWNDNNAILKGFPIFHMVNPSNTFIGLHMSMQAIYIFDYTWAYFKYISSMLMSNQNFMSFVF